MELEKDPYLFTSLQLEEIVRTTPSLKTRLSMIALLGPRLIDPNGRITVFTDMFRFADDKRAVEEVLKSRANMLSRSQFLQGDHSRRGSASAALLRSNSGFNSPAACSARRSSVGVKGPLSPAIVMNRSSPGLRDLLTADEPTASGMISELSTQQALQWDTTASSPVDKQPTTATPSALVKMYTDNLKSAAKASPASSAYDSFRRESSQVEQLVRRIEATRKLASGGVVAKGHSAARRESKLTFAEKSDGSVLDPDLLSSGMDLLNADARSMDLLNANARSMDLLNADARSMDLRDADARSMDLLNADARSMDLRDADARSMDHDIVAHYQQEIDRQSQYISELEQKAESEGKLHQEELWSLRAELACLEKEIEVLRARASGETGVAGDERDRPDSELEEEEEEEEDRKAVRITERVSIETYAGPIIVRKELSLPAMKYTRRTSRCSFYRQSTDEYAAISSLLSDYGSTVAQLKSVEQELVRQQQLVGELRRDKEVEASSARRSAALAARAVQRRVEVEQQLADALFHCEQLHRELTTGLVA